MATRINSQLDADTKGFAASLHRFGFYFRPATLFVVAAGVVAIGIASTLTSPPKPAAVTAEKTGMAPAAKAASPADDGRVTVYFSESEKEKKDAVAQRAAPAPASPLARGNESKNAVRQEPGIDASVGTARVKEEMTFAPERDEPTLGAAPAPPAASSPRHAADESASEAEAVRKQAAPETRLRAATSAAAGSVRAAGTVEVVGKTAGSLRLTAPARLDGLSGPFDGTYRLELDGSGRVTDVARLFGGSGYEPAGLPERLRGLSFAPADVARTAGSVDVRIRLP
jgi:hypothetical protein